MALAQDLDPNRLLPSPPGVGDAAPAAVFATMGVFTGFSPEVPGAKDPIPIVPWDDDGDSGSDDAMDDFDEDPRELFADDEVSQIFSDCAFTSQSTIESVFMHGYIPSPMFMFEAISCVICNKLI